MDSKMCKTKVPVNYNFTTLCKPPTMEIEGYSLGHSILRRRTNVHIFRAPTHLQS